MEEPEEAFCIIRKYFGANQKYTVHRVKDIFYRDEQLKKFVECTVDDLLNDNLTFRLKINDWEGNRYIHVAIVKVTSDIYKIIYSLKLQVNLKRLKIICTSLFRTIRLLLCSFCNALLYMQGRKKKRKIISQITRLAEVEVRG